MSVDTGDRVLVLAPTWRDAEVLGRTLATGGIRSVACPSLVYLLDGIREGAGAAIVADEALGAEARGALAAALAEQPAWSELPLVVMASRGEQFGRGWTFLRQSGRAAQAVLLERPVHTATLLSAVRSALRARERQYQVRDELARRRQAEEALKAITDQLETELASARRLQAISSLMLQGGGADALYPQILDAAIAVMHSDMGSMQILDPDRGELRLLAWKGFHPESAAYWERVRPESSCSCGAALRDGRRVVVADIEKCDFVVGRPDLDAFRRSAIRAAQTTPLVSRSGRVLGMLSTHWRRPYRPPERDLRTLDVLARQAADLIERSQAEAELREGAARFRALADNIAQLAWMADETGWIFWYNKRWFDYTGTTLEQMQGWGWRAVHHPEHVDRVVEKFRHHIETGQVWEDTFPLRGKDGQYRWFLSRAFPIRDDQGRVTRWFGTNTDVTEQQRVEQSLAEAKRLAEAANRAKGEFLANMSHEIRTPMTAILGYTDILAAHLHDPDDLDCVETIRRNGRFLVEIVNDILDLSKIEAGKLEIEPERFAPDHVVLEVRSLMNVRAREKRLPLIVEYDGPVPETIENDPTRLRQVLINLVGNAIKFTEVGSVRVVVRLDADRRQLVFEVIDTGIGMSPEQQIRLFEPFMQAEGGMTRRFGGSGLGLAICKRLVEMLGGEIAVRSAPGRGSTFSFGVATGPLEGVSQVEPRRDVITSPPEDQETAPRLDARVLVVDDRREVRHLAQHYLEEAGVEVVTADNGRQALEAVERSDRDGRPFDAVILDEQMPVMDGFETVARLRKIGFDRPVLALTAHAMQGDRERALDAGFDDHIAKPIDGGKLVRILAQHARRASPRRPDGPRPSPPVEGRTRRVLLVDDSEDACRVMARLLQMSGHDVRTANDGRSALKAARSYRPEVVVLDIGLPDIDGCELARRLRATQGLADVLLIALSGRGERDDRDRALEAGADHYLVKPARPEDLEALLVPTSLRAVDPRGRSPGPSPHDASPARTGRRVGPRDRPM